MEVLACRFNTEPSCREVKGASLIELLSYAGLWDQKTNRFSGHVIR